MTREKMLDSLTETQTRRGFLKATAGSAVIGAGFSNSASAQTATLRFGGRVAGWQGRSPSAIENEVNPTLPLLKGAEYTVWWTNLDGAPHNFVIQSENGNSITGTPTLQSQGQEVEFTFTVSEDMAQYICTIHPNTMLGDIEVVTDPAEALGAGQQQGAGGTTTTTTTTETGNQTQVPYEENTKPDRSDRIRQLIQTPGFDLFTAVAGLTGAAGLLKWRADSEE